MLQSSRPHPGSAFFFDGAGDHRDLHSFPTRRSSDLFGTKRGLFLACHDAWHARLAETFADASRDVPTEERFAAMARSEEHTSELQSRRDLVCRLLLEKKKDAHGLRHLRERSCEGRQP